MGSKIKYLGIWIKSGARFNIDITESRGNSFRSVNCILNKTKFSCDLVKLTILESQCLPTLLCCSESGCLDNLMLKNFNSFKILIIRYLGEKFGYHK